MYARRPDSDPKRAAQKAANRNEYVPQTNPIEAAHQVLCETDGFRPGAPDSAHQLHPDMQHPNGWRPSGSWSTSAHNVGEGKMTNAHTRRMVMNDVTEYNAAVHNDPALYYRSGRPKLSVGSVPTEFRNGLETAEEGARGH